jgi:hypothetical protein
VRMNGDATNRIRLTPADVERVITSPPKGRIYHAKARPQGVRETNKLIVQCAEELVFSSGDDPGIRELTRKYARYRIDTDVLEVRKPEEPDAVYHGFVTRVKETR